MGGDIIPEQHHWCPKQEKLLIRWAEKAAGYRWLHNHARMFYKKQNDWLSYPCIIISSITGVGGFAVLSPNDQNMTSDQKQKIVIFQYFFAFMNVIAGILTSISKFNNSSRMMEAHSVMSVQYSKFYRNIDMELSLETKYREDVLDFVNKVRLEYDRLLDEAPDIPSHTIEAFNETFPGKENKPDVCNGLSIISQDMTKSDEIRTSNVVKKWILKQKSSRQLPTPRQSLDLESHPSCGV
tara:strand:- start:395 stop:1111 length:717 start_codon:yes stop_codon:yes gene_type:complete